MNNWLIGWFILCEVIFIILLRLDDESKKEWHIYKAVAFVMGTIASISLFTIYFFVTNQENNNVWVEFILAFGKLFLLCISIGLFIGFNYFLSIFLGRDKKKKSKK